MTDWLEPIAKLSEKDPQVIPNTNKQARAIAQQELRRLEDEVFEEAAEVCRLAMRFADIPDNLDGPPEEWIAEFGQKEAERQFRYITAAQKNARESPTGIKVATTVLVGLLRSRAEKQPPRPMNVQIAILSKGDLATYPVQVSDSQGDAQVFDGRDD